MSGTPVDTLCGNILSSNHLPISDSNIRKHNNLFPIYKLLLCSPFFFCKRNVKSTPGDKGAANSKCLETVEEGKKECIALNTFVFQYTFGYHQQGRVEFNTVNTSGTPVIAVQFH